MNLYAALNKNIKEAEEREFIKRVKDVNGTFFNIYKKDGKYVDEYNNELDKQELKAHNLLEKKNINESDSYNVYRVSFDYDAEGWPSDSEPEDIENSVVDYKEISDAVEKVNGEEIYSESSWDGDTLSYSIEVGTSASLEEVKAAFEGLTSYSGASLNESETKKLHESSSVQWDDLTEDIQNDINDLETVALMKCEDCSSIVKTDDVTETKQVSMEDYYGVGSDFPDHNYQEFSVCPRCGSIDIYDIGDFDYTDFEDIFDEDGNMIEDADNSEEINQLEDRILDYERHGRGSQEQYEKDKERLSQLKDSESLTEYETGPGNKGYIIKVKNDYNDGYDYEGCGGRRLVKIESGELSVFKTLDEAKKQQQRYKDPSDAEILSFDGKEAHPLDDGTLTELKETEA